MFHEMLYSFGWALDSMLLFDLMTKTLKMSRIETKFRSSKTFFVQVTVKFNLTISIFHNVSVNSNWVHPPPPPGGLAQKNLPGGRDLTFKSCLGPGNSTMAGIL